MFLRPAFALSVLIALPVCAAPWERGGRNTDLQPVFPEQFRAEMVDSGVALRVETIADGLDHPWGIAVLPEGGYLVTERSGALRRVSEGGEVSAPLAGVPEVFNRRQGGLLDVTLAPDFAESRRVYLTYSKPMGSGRSVTAAGYGVLTGDGTALDGFTEIFAQTPPSPTPMHYGSRILFDGAGHVFVTTGEHSSPQERVFAQDLDTTYGKVIRLTPEGDIPADNPFVGDETAIASIWSYGHRNMQGATLHEGALWTIEHGPAGGDELNRPEPGKNYGWPVISYGQNYNGSPVGSGEAQAEGMEQPVYFWDPVIAPGGMISYSGEAFGAWQGDLFIASLNPGGIVRLSLEDGRVQEEERLATDLGRVRDVAQAPDGAILAVTDADNGRLVRIVPAPGG
ncbi:PQQ-dependent sugar dehydrogenase [Litorisediminicola beolgyonensis]|uniref:PQQ-dependent sugar dehydrogenase n=1 Tax=Litorisediminicola beolgyonensis TaxID=1173614 RepID=A0ABW3ZMC4_9RHOB